MDHITQDSSGTTLNSSGYRNEANFVKNQPLLALSSVGAIVGSINALLRKIKRVSSVNLFRVPRKYTKFVPKYLRSNYVAVPALAIIFLASARRIKSILVQ